MRLDKEQKNVLMIIIPILTILAFVSGFAWLIWEMKSLVCGNWSFDAQLCKDYIDGYSKLVSITATSITLAVVSVSAFYAVSTYRRNATVEHAKWLFTLYEKFYEKEDLKKVRNILDNNETSDEIENYVQNEPFEFTDYLNFFEFVAFLEKSKQLTLDEIDDLFGYYLSCIDRHESVREYLFPHGYELLDKMLERRAKQRKGVTS